jgi:hypothetical protein
MVNRDGDYERARAFLTRRAAGSWSANGPLTTYDAGGVELRRRTSEGSTTVTFTAPRIGSIDGRGEFAPLRGSVRTSFGLVKENGEWRIDRLRDGVLLSSSDATRAYRFANVYYANRSGAALVPEQVLLPPEPRGVATALVRALLSGPGGWLAPAVRTGFPAGTDLLGNVPVNQGVAEVNLSAAVRRASSADLRTLSAQLVWTLRQVPDISGVRLLADSSPLAVPGVQVVQGRDQWYSVDPIAGPRVPGAFHRQGSAWVVVGREPFPPLDRLDGLREVAVSRGGDRVAALRTTRSGTSLIVVQA